ncbi:MAG TPA: flagellar basal body L-ring protein FlgH [Fimbriimonadaceae bacterium]|nr:flagellar basal body L-ring protein FlgH [Fimbriimonadaceae bacterium]
MKLLTTLVLIASATWAFAQDQDAGSLFNGKIKNPYLSRTAKCVGDILTIVVSESSAANYSVATQATKKDDNNVAKAMLPFLSALNVPLIDQLLGGLSTGAQSSNNGTGSTTQSGKFSTRVAVTVREVQPNGNMLIEGTRLIKINKEEQQITFTGIIREDDIRADNTILSERVADARITNLGKGLAADRQRRGILTWILDWLF